MENLTNQKPDNNMNTKQTVPLAVTLAPVIAAAPQLLIGGAIGLGVVLLVKWLVTPDKDKQPDATPPKQDTEASRKPAETVVIREIPARPVVQPVPSVPRPPTPPAIIRPVPAAPLSPVAPIVKATSLALPQPAGKKFVTRADLAAIFDNGARALNRKAAVAALKRLGFGKTAAYSALSPDGRFNVWLQCAPDGMITWKN